MSEWSGKMQILFWFLLLFVLFDSCVLFRKNVLHAYAIKQAPFNPYNIALWILFMEFSWMLMMCNICVWWVYTWMFLCSGRCVLVDIPHEIEISCRIQHHFRIALRIFCILMCFNLCFFVFCFDSSLSNMAALL